MRDRILPAFGGSGAELVFAVGIGQAGQAVDALPSATPSLAAMPIGVARTDRPVAVE